MIIKTETDITNKVVETRPAWARKTPVNNQQQKEAPLSEKNGEELDAIDELEKFYSEKKEVVQQSTPPRQQKVEYKYAFGMKIPKKHDWVVRQRTEAEVAESERRRARLNAISEILYD